MSAGEEEEEGGGWGVDSRDPASWVEWLAVSMAEGGEVLFEVMCVEHLEDGQKKRRAIDHKFPLWFGLVYTQGVHVKEISHIDALMVDLTKRLVHIRSSRGPRLRCPMS